MMVNIWCCKKKESNKPRKKRFGVKVSEKGRRSGEVEKESVTGGSDEKE